MTIRTTACPSMKIATLGNGNAGSGRSLLPSEQPFHSPIPSFVNAANRRRSLNAVPRSARDFPLALYFEVHRASNPLDQASMLDISAKQSNRLGPNGLDIKATLLCAPLHHRDVPRTILQPSGRNPHLPARDYQRRLPRAERFALRLASPVVREFFIATLAFDNIVFSSLVQVLIRASPRRSKSTVPNRFAMSQMLGCREPRSPAFLAIRLALPVIPLIVVRAQLDALLTPTAPPGPCRSGAPYMNGVRHIGQVVLLEDWNHLYRHVLWNLVPHTRQASRGRARSCATTQ